MEERSSQGNVVSISDVKSKNATIPPIRPRRPNAEEMVSEFLKLLGEQGDPEALFHTPERELFARIRVNGHMENWPLKSSGFKSWLNHAYFRLTGTIPGEKIERLLLKEFSGNALFEGSEVPVSLRVAEHDGKIYVDLCDPAWRLIEVSSTGWNVISEETPVRFRRSPGMLPLPVPQKGGEIEELLRFLNLGNRDDQLLLLSWILCAFRSTGPYPILALHGTQGSGKSTAANVIRRLTDPAQAALRTSPRDERDLLIASRHSHVIAFDNLSGISGQLSDALCRLATGSGFATRKLYSDDEQMIFSAQRPILLNGIENVASRGDLLDRMLLIRLPSIKATERSQEKTFWADFEEARPRILGALMDALVATLRGASSVAPSNLPRMADFAARGIAAESGLGFGPGEFLGAYARNHAEATFAAIEASPAIAEIPRLLRTSGGCWEGSSGDLLATLERGVASDCGRRDSNWPRSARAMAGELERGKINLEQVGVVITRLPREAGSGRRRFRLSIVTNVTPESC